LSLHPTLAVKSARPFQKENNVHAYAASTSTVPRSKVTKRLFIPKLLILPALAFALVSKHIYVEDGFWDTTWEVVSFLVLLVAAVGRLWTSAYISGRKDHELVVDGPYSITRNPLYFFSFLAYVGAGLAFEKLSAALVFGIVFWVSHWTTILGEEKKLRGIYGETYDEYARTVPRFWPRVGQLKLLDSVSFSPKIFNRAVLDCGLIMSVFILAHLIEYAQTAGWVPVYFHNVW
jgi:protein-S-isoprenylcysteine O-methyltransferase Ste14